MLEGSIKKVTWEKVAIAIKAMQLEKAAGPSQVLAQMISASKELEISVMFTQLCLLC